MVLWVYVASPFFMVGVNCLIGPANERGRESFRFGVLFVLSGFLFLGAFVMGLCSLFSRMRWLEKEVMDAPLIDNDDLCGVFGLRTATVRGNVLVVENAIDPRALEREIEEQCCEDLFARRYRITGLIINDAELSQHSKDMALSLVPVDRRALACSVLRLVLSVGPCLASGIACLRSEFSCRVVLGALFFAPGGITLLLAGATVCYECSSARRIEKELTSRLQHAIGTE
jgi:hypothetical protein